MDILWLRNSLGQDESNLRCTDSCRPVVTAKFTTGYISV